jgi:hypothetical protein
MKYKKTIAKYVEYVKNNSISKIQFYNKESGVSCHQVLYINIFCLPTQITCVGNQKD